MVKIGLKLVGIWLLRFNVKSFASYLNSKLIGLNIFHDVSKCPNGCNLINAFGSENCIKSCTSYYNRQSLGTGKCIY